MSGRIVGVPYLLLQLGRRPWSQPQPLQATRIMVQFYWSLIELRTVRALG